MSYIAIAMEQELDPATATRFLTYMLGRWIDTEEQKCKDGYAAEWALRFKHGREWQASDIVGQSLLTREYPHHYPPKEDTDAHTLK